MVVGNLWAVTDTASDAIMMDTLNNWLPKTSEMKRDAELGRAPLHNTKELCKPVGNYKEEPELLYAVRRFKCSQHHYMSTAALVFRGLPITATGSVEKSS